MSLNILLYIVNTFVRAGAHMKRWEECCVSMCVQGVVWRGMRWRVCCVSICVDSHVGLQRNLRTIVDSDVEELVPITVQVYAYLPYE